MPICKKCGLDVCQPCVPVPQNPKQEIIVVASDRALSCVSHFQRLAMATRALDMPRRKIPDWIADTIYGCKGKIVWSDGTPFIIGDTEIDDAFSNDGSFRWLSDFIGFADHPPVQAPQRRLLARLRLIYLAFQIAYPDRAALIAR